MSTPEGELSVSCQDVRQCKAQPPSNQATPVEPVSAISGSMALCIGAHNPRLGADSFFAILVAQVP